MPSSGMAARTAFMYESRGSMRIAGPKRAVRSLPSISCLLGAGGMTEGSASGELLERQAGVAQHGQGVGVVPSQFVRVDVDLHHLGVVREHGGCEPRSHCQEDVVMHEVRAKIVGARLQRTHGEVVGVGYRPLPLVCRHHGRLEVFGHAKKRLGRTGGEDASACPD